MLEKSSLADQINVKKKRFFSTISENSKTGGSSIFFPQCYDNVINIVYEKADKADIPRFLSVICSIVGGPNFLLTFFMVARAKRLKNPKFSAVYIVTSMRSPTSLEFQS